MLLQQRMDELGERDQGYPLSYRQVSQRSVKGKKPRVSPATVGNAFNGKYVRLGGEQVAGLATALEVDEQTIRAAINQSVALTMELPARFAKLSPEAWARLVEHGDYLLFMEGKAAKPPR